MLQNIKDLYGDRIGATDGHIGHVKDFYFDDKTWLIRYIVANTGSWLSGRLVLLSPNSIGCFHHGEKMLLVNITREQVENSPGIESHEPISRHYEEALHRYYGWPGYWQAADMLLGLSNATTDAATADTDKGSPIQNRDIHLRSARAVTGYTVHATDGEIGSLRGFMVDDKNWEISQFVIETGPWYSTKEITLPTSHATRIAFAESSVFLNLSKADIRSIAEHELALAGPRDLGPQYFTD